MANSFVLVIYWMTFRQHRKLTPCSCLHAKHCKLTEKIKTHNAWFLHCCRAMDFLYKKNVCVLSMNIFQIVVMSCDNRNYGQNIILMSSHVFLVMVVFSPIFAICICSMTFVPFPLFFYFKQL